MKEAVQKVEDFHKTEYFKNIKPIPGAREVLDELKKNNDLYVITARSENIRKDTEEWIEKYYPNIFSKVYLTNHYALNGTETSKKKVCDSLDVDIFIEDNIKYAEECVGPNRKIYLLDYPWNQSDKLPQNIIRVHSWKEINIK